ncbi:hypothetical protein ACQ4PT_052384 [Festuca glaucescens]
MQPVRHGVLPAAVAAIYDLRWVGGAHGAEVARAYERASTWIEDDDRMKSIVERYQEVMEGQQFMSASAEAKFWKADGARMEQQLHNLQENHRQLLGQHLSGLGLEDLKSLENQLDMSLHNIRLTKEQLMIDEIEELNKKVRLGSLVHQENIELHKKLNMIRQENVDLQNKLNVRVEVNGGNTSSYFDQYNIAAPEDVIPIQELSQPHPAERDEQPESPTLR